MRQTELPGSPVLRWPHLTGLRVWSGSLFLLQFTIQKAQGPCSLGSCSSVQAQSSDPLKSKHQLDLERAYFLVTQAFDEDEKGNSDEAIELYTQAVELCIQAVSTFINTQLHFDDDFLLTLIVISLIPNSIPSP